MTPYKATLTQQASALVYDLRQRINPQYSDQRGTESCERKECADMIDSLLAELAAMRDQKPIGYIYLGGAIDAVGCVVRETAFSGELAIYAAPGAQP